MLSKKHLLLITSYWFYITNALDTVSISSAPLDAKIGLKDNKSDNWRHPLHWFTAPQLRTTVLDSLVFQLSRVLGLLVGYIVLRDRSKSGSRRHCLKGIIICILVLLYSIAIYLTIMKQRTGDNNYLQRWLL